MAGMQHAPPENPDALAPGLEERDNLHPPVARLLREKFQTRARQLHHALRAGGDVEFFRKHFAGRRLGRADKFAEEAPFGEKLVLQDFGDRRRFGMRTEAEVGVAEAAPDGDDLIGFAGVDVEQMLEERIGLRGTSCSGMAMKS